MALLNYCKKITDNISKYCGLGGLKINAKKTAISSLLGKIRCSRGGY